MKNKPIIGVDVDLTIVRTDLAWIEYVGNVLFPNNPGEAFAKIAQWKKLYGSVPYNISEVFLDELQSFSEGQQGLYDFWRSETLYNELEPVEGAVEALRELSEEYRIVFCSAHKGWHAKSKYYFLDRWFPFHSGVVLTKEKWLCSSGWYAIIDDRVDILNKCLEENRDIEAIHFPTMYEQSEHPNWMIQNCGNDWKTIAEQIKLRSLLGNK